MKKTSMKTVRGMIHQVAVCQICGKMNEDHKGGAAQKWAYKHAMKTGHTVLVETGSFILYNYHPLPPKP